MRRMLLAVVLFSTFLVSAGCDMPSSKTSLGLEIESSKFLTDSDGSIVMGIATRADSAPEDEDCIIDVAFLDSENAIVHTEQVVAAIAPGQSEVFEAACTTVDVTNYSLSLDVWTVVNSVVFHECLSRVEGVAKNNTDGVMEHPRVVIQFSDVSEHVLCTGFDACNALEPSEVWNFTVYCWFGTAVSYEIVLNHPPPIPTTVILPDNPTTVDDLYCSMEFTFPDLDGDSLYFSYEWHCNGVLAAKIGNSDWVDSTHTTKGDI